MSGGAVSQSKPAIPGDCLTDTGSQICFRRNFPSRDIDIGQSAGCQVGYC